MAKRGKSTAPGPATAELSSNRPGTKVLRPATGEPRPTPDPTTFLVKHPSDGPFYDAIKAFNAKHGVHSLPFPAPRGGGDGNVPVLTLEEVLGSSPDAAGSKTWIENNDQIVFHALGDCGSTKGPKYQNDVVDKMLADFVEAKDKEVPQFHVLLGDVVYSFGEVKYYYDQFYDPYRDYPAPILAAAGNHDAMIAPGLHSKSLEGFLRNFCSEDFQVMPEAGGLARTAQIQPGVFFTFEAPFVAIIFLYSNALEDPGVIADSDIGNSQLTFLEAALTRLKNTPGGFKGALLFAHHHPAYTLSRHGWSIDMQAQIDEICDKVGLWPHADLAGHAHNYQRFTRRRSDGTEVPYVVCGNGGHNVQRLKMAGGGAIRAPQVIQQASTAKLPSPQLDQVTFENYDDQNYGYLRIVVDGQQLRIEYHPASDGAEAKTPDDSVTVDLAKRQLVHFSAPDLGQTEAAKEVARIAAKAKGAGPAAPEPRGPKIQRVSVQRRKKVSGRRASARKASVSKKRRSRR